MKCFYTNWMAHKDKGKAASLRAAQLSLLQGDTTAAGTTTRSTAKLARAVDGKPFTPEPHRPFAHPYYWAPFILFGNWK